MTTERESGQEPSAYAVTLNALSEMQKSAVYATRKDVLACAENHIVALERQLSAARAELETERMRLAACGVAAAQNTEESVKERILRGHPYWSSSYAEVCHAVDREMALRAELAQRDERIKVLEDALRLETKNELAGR